MSLSFGIQRPRRRPSLTPMVDVVFLLLVFFMLAARFGVDRVMELSPATQGDAVWQGAPRLIEIAPGETRLNGTPVPIGALATRLAPLMPEPSSPVVLRPVEGAVLQDIVRVTDALREAGLGTVVLVE